VWFVNVLFSAILQLFNCNRVTMSLRWH